MIVALLVLAAAATPPTPSPDARSYRYRVHKGDSLTRLAVDYLQGPDALRAVMRANAIPSQRPLRVNETLIVPYRLMRRAPVDGAVVAFRGPVQVSGRTATVGAGIGEGATIATGANASTSIRFPDGTTTSIPSNSRVRVLRLTRYLLTGEVDREFAVEEGGSEWHVTPARLPGDRLRVRTPVAVAAVRGTEFRVTYRLAGKLSGSSVVKGEVGFTAGGNAPTSLPKGIGAAADPGLKIDKRVLLPAPTLTGDFARQAGTELYFAVESVAGAKVYRTIVARDAGFVDVVADTRSAEPLATLPGVQDGDYFVRVSAIDAVNLEGFAQDAAFQRKFAPLSAGDVRQTGDEAYFPWSYAGTPTGPFHFVLARKADLSRPILDVPQAPRDGVTVAHLPPGTYYWRVSGDDPAVASGLRTAKIRRR